MRKLKLLMHIYLEAGIKILICHVLITDLSSHLNHRIIVKERESQTFSSSLCLSNPEKNSWGCFQSPQ